ncbi:MAG: OmpA family protein [Nitrospiraceae bacterium]
METGNGTIVINLPESVLFNSGEARVKSEALPFLQSLSEILVEMDRHVRVLGHTDNVPIRTAQFPSNWELSAARAVMVVRILSELNSVPRGTCRRPALPIPVRWFRMIPPKGAARIAELRSWYWSVLRWTSRRRARKIERLSRE